MSTDPSHLVERVAERLRGIGGLTAPEPPPEREARRAEEHEAEPPSDPHFTPRGTDPAGEHMPERVAEHVAAALDVPPPDHTQPAFPPGEAEGHGGPAPEIEADAAADAAVGTDPAGTVVDATRRFAPALADSTALAVPGPERLPPLDMASLEQAGLVVGHKVRTRISEEFRITVGHILRSMHSNYSPGRGAPNVIMVTSARPGEGKSFSSLNLAGSIAQHTQREVLLVDVDAKQHSITSELGLSDRPGLLDLSANNALRIEDVIIRTAIPHLSVIAVGSGHSVGADNSPTRPVTALVERIARRFPNSVVLLDAPPCLSTSDPSTLAPFVGQIVMVVEAERTQRNEVVAALDLVKACPSVTLMLNKIRLTTSYTFGAYHYFGTYS